MTLCHVTFFTPSRYLIRIYDSWICGIRNVLIMSVMNS
jgi:hypothetical protein